MKARKPIEKRRLVRAWIWFWYSEATRLLFVMLPGHFILTAPLLYGLGVPDEHFSTALGLVYALVFVWAMVDNDFENLERIGLDTNRRKLPPEPAA